jgi:hypothetical protein
MSSRPPPRPLLRLCVLGLFVLACGASGTASSKPRAKSPAHTATAATRPAPAAQPISALTAERVKLVWEAAAGGFGRGVAISRKLGRVAVSSGNQLQLYDVSTGKRVGAIASCREVLRGGLAFADGKLVVVCDNSVELWDARRLARLQAPKTEPQRATAAAIVWPRLALGHRDGVIRLYGLDGSPSIAIRVPGPPIDVKSLDLTRDGSKLAVAWVQGSVWWWRTSEPDKPHELVRHENESDSVAFSDDGALFAEEGRTAFTTVWALSSPPVEKARLKNGDWIKRLLFTRDARWLVRGGSDGLELAEIAGPKRVALDTRGSVEDVSLDEQGSSLAAIDRDGRLSVWAIR